MNIHMAQSVQARNELKHIANVKFQIIGAKDSKPIIGLVQDGLSGAYLLTQSDVKIRGSDVANMLCNTTSETKFEVDMNKYYTGQEIFSFIIPKGINNTKYKDGVVKLEIKNGELKVGVLDKASLSKVGGSIIHFIWDKYGPEQTKQFIDNSQRLVLAFLYYRGFTFGFEDCLIMDNVHQQILTLIKNKILEYKVSLTQYENDTDQLDPKFVEGLLSSDLLAFSSNIGPILMKQLNHKNNLYVCVDSGSRGNTTNVQHIMGTLGQRQMEGVRIKKNVESRSLPIFHKNDDTPEARGFIKSCFMDGLDSVDFFYDAKAGREGLIDTAIKSVTWETAIVIIENNKPKYTKIGKWIDDLLDKNKDNVQHFEERQMELLDIENVLISTTDYFGNVTWGNISAVTRHDPGEALYEIKTSSGRSVIVTESKSLLIWNYETQQFKEELTPQIKVGDHVPITLKLAEPTVTTTCNFKTVINKLEKNIFPDDLYGASNDFIKKVLQEEFKRRANIMDKYTILTYDNSKICEGILMLCSRFGIFGYHFGDRIAFDKYYTQMINNTIIKILPYCNYEDIFEKLNDVILDNITEINLIDVKLHKKVYDLTIPTTFNFGLANGLQVRDTAKTGYVQRQLIKGLEDLSIKYDNTNRNSRNVIIQYVYGENGINQSCQTENTINLISMNNDKIEEVFGFNKSEMSKIKEKDLDKFNKKYINKIKKYRDDLRIIQTRANNNYKILEVKYMLPVNLFRLTQDYSNKKENFELSPKYIDEEIENLLNSYDTKLLPGLRETDKYLVNDDRSLKYLLEIAIHDYLCPKKCIFVYGFSKAQFKNILEDIKISFIKALVEPGEMVGIVAAQSIGEPTSQIINFV